MLLKSAAHFGVEDPLSMIRERYAFFSAHFPTPSGIIRNCFHVADTPSSPTIDGLPIPEKDYVAEAILELDFSKCTPYTASAMICK